MEGLRTRAGKLAAAARALNAAGGVAAPFALAFLTDPRGPDPDLVARVLPAGAALILRHYGNPRRAALARSLRVVTAARGVRLLIGGDAALARSVGADGVHWRSNQIACAKAGDGLLASAACHTFGDLSAAARAGAAVVLLSPVFETRSHPDAVPLGSERFFDLAGLSSLPVLALGGVDETNAPALRGPNVAGFAAIGAFAARTISAPH